MSSELSEGGEDSPRRIEVAAPDSSSSDHRDRRLDDSPRRLRRLQVSLGRQYVLRFLRESRNHGQLAAAAAAAASTASMEAMPRVAVTEHGAECAICLEGMEIGDEGRELPCKHRFHSLCIEAWLRRRGSCPLCRFSMPNYELPPAM